MILSPFSSPVVAAIAAVLCERLCMSAPSTIIRLVLLFTDRQLDARRTWLARERCHAPIKPRRASRIGDERHCERKSGPAADSLKQRVSSPPARDLLLRVGRHRQAESEQQARARRDTPRLPRSGSRAGGAT